MFLVKKFLTTILLLTLPVSSGFAALDGMPVAPKKNSVIAPVYSSFQINQTTVSFRLTPTRADKVDYAYLIARFQDIISISLESFQEKINVELYLDDWATVTDVIVLREETDGSISKAPLKLWPYYSLEKISLYFTEFLHEHEVLFAIAKSEEDTVKSDKTVLIEALEVLKTETNNHIRLSREKTPSNSNKNPYKLSNLNGLLDDIQSLLDKTRGKHSGLFTRDLAHWNWLLFKPYITLSTVVKKNSRYWACELNLLKVTSTK